MILDMQLDAVAADPVSRDFSSLVLLSGNAKDDSADGHEALRQVKLADQLGILDKRHNAAPDVAGEGYQKMIEAVPARRVGTADEIAAAGAILLGEEAGFITGIDLLIDGGVIAAMNSRKYQLG